MVGTLLAVTKSQFQVVQSSCSILGFIDLRAFFATTATVLHTVSLDFDSVAF